MLFKLVGWCGCIVVMSGGCFGLLVVCWFYIVKVGLVRNGCCG